MRQDGSKDWEWGANGRGMSEFVFWRDDPMVIMELARFEEQWWDEGS